MTDIEKMIAERTPKPNNCKWCGKPVPRKSNRGPAPEYCNHSHRQMFYFKNLENTKPGEYKGRLKSFTCEVCGTFKENVAKHKVPKTCGEKCRKIWVKNYQKNYGKDNRASLSGYLKSYRDDNPKKLKEWNATRNNKAREKREEERQRIKEAAVERSNREESVPA